MPASPAEAAGPERVREHRPRASTRRARPRQARRCGPPPGARPALLKKPTLTIAPVTRSGISKPVSVKLAPCSAPNSASDWFMSRMSQKFASVSDVCAQAARRQRSPDLDEPVRLGKGQRLQQHAVDDAEDRGGGADAERQHQHDPGGQRRLAAHQAHRSPNVAQNHERPPSSAVVVRFATYRRSFRRKSLLQSRVAGLWCLGSLVSRDLRRPETWDRRRHAILAPRKRLRPRRASEARRAAASGGGAPRAVRKEVS